MMQETKTIKEVFRDYEATTNIVEGKIHNIDVYKKDNKLGMVIFSSKYIQIKDLLNFEQYLINRFSIENIEIQIKYDKEVQIPKIENEWNNIILYMADKFPITRVLLQNSEINIDGNNLNVILSIKGAEFLIARGIQKKLESIIFNLYETNYKVNFIEEIKEETIKAIENKSKLTEKFAIEKASQEIHEKEETAEKPSENVKEARLQPIEQPQEEEEKSPLVLGRSANIKEEIVKIKDISIDTRKISFRRRNYKSRF